MLLDNMISGVAECFPTAVHPHLAFIRSIPETRPSTSAVCARIRALSRFIIAILLEDFPF